MKRSWTMCLHPVSLSSQLAGSRLKPDMTFRLVLSGPEVKLWYKHWQANFSSTPFHDYSLWIDYVLCARCVLPQANYYSYLRWNCQNLSNLVRMTFSSICKCLKKICNPRPSFSLVSSIIYNQWKTPEYISERSIWGIPYGFLYGTLVTYGTLSLALCCIPTFKSIIPYSILPRIHASSNFNLIKYVISSSHKSIMKEVCHGKMPDVYVLRHHNNKIF